MPTWGAPGRPDVEENDPAAEIGKGQGAAFAIFERDRLNRLRLVMQDEPWRLIGADRLGGDAQVQQAKQDAG
jgi:hypothetical protein